MPIIISHCSPMLSCPILNSGLSSHFTSDLITSEIVHHAIQQINLHFVGSWILSRSSTSSEGSYHQFPTHLLRILTSLQETLRRSGSVRSLTSTLSQRQGTTLSDLLNQIPPLIVSIAVRDDFSASVISKRQSAEDIIKILEQLQAAILPLIVARDSSTTEKLSTTVGKRQNVSLEDFIKIVQQLQPLMLPLIAARGISGALVKRQLLPQELIDVLNQLQPLLLPLIAARDALFEEKGLYVRKGIQKTRPVIG